jgi:hypothetical protein
MNVTGTYRFYDDNELVGEYPNIITEDGRGVVLQFLTGARNGFAEYMAFGIGESEPVVTDTALDFEYHRSQVDLKQAELLSQRIVFRGTVPDEKTFWIHEVGLYLDDDVIDDESPTTVITTFDSLDEAPWYMWDGTQFLEEGFSYAGGRTGYESFQLDVPANTDRSLILDAPFGQFGQLADDDQFAISYETLSGGGTMTVRFRVDNNNYRQVVLPLGAGFNTERWTKADFIQTGIAGWDDFRSLEIIVAGTGAGANVIFEGLRYDVVTGNERPVLVSRALLPEPIHKKGTSELQVEYVMHIDFTSAVA